MILPIFLFYPEAHQSGLSDLIHNKEPIFLSLLKIVLMNYRSIVGGDLLVDRFIHLNKKPTKISSWISLYRVKSEREKWLQFWLEPLHGK